MANYNLVNDDCLEILPEIPDDSIDMVLADLPYGTTACDWDSIIPLEPLWEQYKRIGKDDTPYVFTASQPFTSQLIMSNIENFKYDWVWHKTRPTNVLNAKKQPLRNKEDILVFCYGNENYHPQGLVEVNERVGTGATKANKEGNATGEIEQTEDGKYLQEKGNYPRQIQKFKSPAQTDHPTQKPVALFEYLIKTYTNEGDLVLDNVMGSGTAGVACQKTNRRFLGVEQDEEYFEIAQDRIEEAKNTDWERVEGIEEWQQFEGIGEKTAETLYDELGSVEEADMEQLEFISGIGQKTAQSIREESTND